MSAVKAAVNRLLPRAPFARGVGLLVGGTAGSQVLLVLVSPLLTRLYTPDDFGLLAVYSALLALFGVIASLRYQLAIPLPEDDESASNVVALCLIVVAGITLVSALAVFIAGDRIASLLGAPRLARYLWLLPVGVFFSGAQEALRYYAIRRKAFGTIASTSVQRSLVNIVMQLFGFKLGAFGLIAAQATSQGAGSISLGKLFFRRRQLAAISWAGVREQARKYQQFPLFSTWSGFLNTAGQQLPPMLFAALFNPAIAGLYSLANRVLSLPMSVIGSAIGQVFLSEAAIAHREQRLGPLVARLHARLAHIGLPPALLLAFAGPEVFARIFGDQWREAGTYARWMAPWLYLVFVSSPLSSIFSVMEKPKEGMVFQGVLFGTRLLALYIGAMSGSVVVTVACFSLAGAVCWLGFLFWLGHSTGCRGAEMALPTGRAAAVALACSVPMAAAVVTDAPFAMWWSAFALSAVFVGSRLAYMLRRTYQ